MKIKEYFLYDFSSKNILIVLIHFLDFDVEVVLQQLLKYLKILNLLN